MVRLHQHRMYAGIYQRLNFRHVWRHWTKHFSVICWQWQVLLFLFKPSLCHTNLWTKWYEENWGIIFGSMALIIYDRKCKALCREKSYQNLLCSSSLQIWAQGVFIIFLMNRQLKDGRWKYWRNRNDLQWTSIHDILSSHFECDIGESWCCVTVVCLWLFSKFSRIMWG